LLNFINVKHECKKNANPAIKDIRYCFRNCYFYVVLGYLLPFIEVSAKDDGQKKEIPVYIYTNGVHTDIVMPVKNDLQDWSAKLPFNNVRSKKTDYNYVGIGWGDKGFYLDTPTWADLNFLPLLKLHSG
jgi:uncharacterized protein (TIGR02117 family)